MKWGRGARESGIRSAGGLVGCFDRAVIGKIPTLHGFTVSMLKCRCKYQVQRKMVVKGWLNDEQFIEKGREGMCKY